MYGEEGNQLIFKILKRGEHEKSGEADLALRYDLTVPLARVVARVSERAADACSSATRFSRCGARIVPRAADSASSTSATSMRRASTSPIVEAEILGAVSEILDDARIQRFRHAG